MTTASKATRKVSSVTPAESREPKGRDPDKWDQMLYEQANRNHLHQDNLRWSLSGGFGVFFLTSMATINNPQYTSIHAMLHLLQFALVLLGTIYLFVLMIEGWYYNLYLAYLVDCEKRIMSGRHLTTVALFDRKAVKSIHPSYFFILMLVVFANLTHLFQASYDQWRNVPAPMISCAVYACVFLPVALGGRVPKWIDRTLAGPE